MLITNDNFAFAMDVLTKDTGDLGADTETTGFEVRYGTDRLMGFCFSVPDLSCYMPFFHKQDNLSLEKLNHVETLLQKKDTVWHNRKFDMHSIKTTGIDPLKFKGIQYDTMLMLSLIDEESFSKELDYAAKRYLGDSKKKSEEIHNFGKMYGWDALSPEAIEPYGSHDASITRRLKDKLWPLLVAEGLESVYLETEMPFTALLYNLEQRGIGVDLGFSERKASIGRGRMATIFRELGYNPSSPIDLSNNLLQKLDLPVLAHTSSCQQCKAGFPVGTHTGKPSFNKVVMEEYDTILEAMNNPTAQRIAEYRGWQKAVTSLYEPILERNVNGNIRTNFKQHQTVTGRLSASEPNLQQVPRSSPKRWNGNAKSAFVSNREGFKVIGWDYSQLELRLAAAYGSEAILLAEFERHEADPFSLLAPLIFGILTPETRQDTKTFVYANLYGAGLNKIARQLGRTVEETKPLYDNYKRSISGIMAVSQQVSTLVQQRGYVKYWDGRRRHIRSRNDSYKAWNSVCQGGGAQLVKRAMLACQEFEDINECYMVLQVHDEITFMVAEEHLQKYTPLIEHAMTDFPQFGVKFAVESKEWK